MKSKNSDGDHWECGRCGKTYRHEDNFHEDENSTEYWCDACEVARQAGKALGSIRTAKKAAASRKNGAKGGRPVSTYYLLSGEGEIGQWSGPFATTVRGIRQRAAAERCGGDRWCCVYRYEPESGGYRERVVDIDTGEQREVPEID